MARFWSRLRADIHLAREKEYQRGDRDRIEWLDEKQQARKRARKSLAVIVVVVILLAGTGGGVVIVVGNSRSSNRRKQFGAVIASLERFVEQARGLKFKHPVQVQMLTDAQFDESPAVDPTYLEDTLSFFFPVFRPLAINTGGDSPFQVAVAASQREFGFYSYVTGQIIVRGATLTPFTKRVLVHELTHALDDQYYPYKSVECTYGKRCNGLAQVLFEGDARFVENAYVQSLSASDRRRSGPPAGTGGRLPPQLKEFILFPYETGVAFVTALKNNGGNGAVDQAFQAPPVFDNEVLDPRLYLGPDDAPRMFDALPVAGPIGKVLGDVYESKPDRTYLGEEVLRLFLEPTLGPIRTASVAEKWDGDNFATWYNGSKFCIHLIYGFRTPDAGKALDFALQTWATQHPGATARLGDHIDLVSCR